MRSEIPTDLSESQLKVSAYSSVFLSYSHLKKKRGGGGFGESESLPQAKKKRKKKKVVVVKSLLTGTRVFPLRKEGTERIKKILNGAFLWFQLAQLDCRAISWLQITISYWLKGSIYVCVWLTVVMHSEVSQFPAFCHFRKMTQRKICGFCLVLNPNSPVTHVDLKQSSLMLLGQIMTV